MKRRTDRERAWSARSGGRLRNLVRDPTSLSSSACRGIGQRNHDRYTVIGVVPRVRRVRRDTNDDASRAVARGPELKTRLMETHAETPVHSEGAGASAFLRGDLLLQGGCPVAPRRAAPHHVPPTDGAFQSVAVLFDIARSDLRAVTRSFFRYFS